MQIFHHNFARKGAATFLAIAVAILGAWSGEVRAQDAEILLQEAELALEAANRQIVQLEKKLASGGATNQPLEKALVEANKEAEDYRVAVSRAVASCGSHGNRHRQGSREAHGNDS